jgi:hypothetical protein
MKNKTRIQPGRTAGTAGWKRIPARSFFPLWALGFLLSNGSGLSAFGTSVLFPLASMFSGPYTGAVKIQSQSPLLTDGTNLYIGTFTNVPLLAATSLVVNLTPNNYLATFAGAAAPLHFSVPNSAGTLNVLALTTNLPTYLYVPGLAQANTNQYTNGANVLFTNLAPGLIGISSTGGGANLAASPTATLSTNGAGAVAVNVVTNLYDPAGAAAAAQHNAQSAATNLAAAALTGTLTNNTAGISAANVENFLENYSVWTSQNLCTNYFTDPVFGTYQLNGPQSVSYDGTNFTLLSCHDYTFSTGIFMFRGPALNNLALTNYGIVIAPRNVAGQTNFIAPGGIYTENGTNYCPVNGAFVVPDDSGPVYLAQAPAGTTNWTVYTTNGVWCPILQNDTNTWDQHGLFRGSFVKNNGLYYLFLNGSPPNGGPLGECIGFATATNLTGPWTMYAGNPLTINGAPFGGGDCMIFNWNGVWLMSYNTFYYPLNMAYSWNLTNWYQSDYNGVAGPPVSKRSYRWCLVSSNGTYFAVSDTDDIGPGYVNAPVNPVHSLLGILAGSTNLNGSGAGLTGLPAGNLTGTLSPAVLPATVVYNGYTTNSYFSVTNAETNWVNLAYHLAAPLATGGDIVYTNTATNGLVLYAVYGDPAWRTNNNLGLLCWTIATNCPDTQFHALYINDDAEPDAGGNFSALLAPGIWSRNPGFYDNSTPSVLQVLAPTLLAAGAFGGSGVYLTNLAAALAATAGPLVTTNPATGQLAPTYNAGALTNLNPAQLAGPLPPGALTIGTNQLVNLVWTNSAAAVTFATNPVGGVTEFMATNQLPLGAGGGPATPLFPTNLVVTSNNVPVAVLGTNGAASFASAVTVGGALNVAGPQTNAGALYISGSATSLKSTGNQGMTMGDSTGTITVSGYGATFTAGGQIIFNLQGTGDALTVGNSITTIYTTFKGPVGATSLSASAGYAVPVYSEAPTNLTAPNPLTAYGTLWQSNGIGVTNWWLTVSNTTGTVTWLMH